MDIKKQIQSFLREAELYRSHGLLDEAREKYKETAGLIRNSQQIKNKKKLLMALSNKMKILKNDVGRFQQMEKSSTMTRKQQDIVKKIFFFSEDMETDLASLEWATALLVFGQFERALKEFNKLVTKDSLRVIAAKNILRCHMGLSSLDNAVLQYKQWMSDGLFPSEQLENIRFFLENILNRKGFDQTLPRPEEKNVNHDHEINGDEFLDIISIVIPWYNAPDKENGIGFDVNFQKGNMISVIIPCKNQALLGRLKVGSKLKNVRFYSPVAMFKDSCVVTVKTPIDSGPSQGDYTLGMKILNNRESN